MLHDSPLASGDLPIDSRDSPEAASMLKIHVERVARFGDRPFVASSPIVVRLQLILATRQRAAKTREQVAAEERRVSRNRLAERRREKRSHQALAEFCGIRIPLQRRENLPAPFATRRSPSRQGGPVRRDRRSCHSSRDASTGHAVPRAPVGVRYGRSAGSNGQLFGHLHG